MKRNAIHKGLNTAFIQLPALVVHLRRLQFVGEVKIEFHNYEAEIIFNGGATVRAREYDHSAGSMSEGIDAFRRILHRAKEPGGRVEVFFDPQFESADTAATAYVDRRISATARRSVTADAGTRRPVRVNFRRHTFDGGANVGFGDSLVMMTEVFRAVEMAFAGSELRFSEIFSAACGVLSFEYPLLDPQSGLFYWRDGKLFVSRTTAAAELNNASIAVLKHILKRIREQGYYDGVHHRAAYLIRVVIRNRRRHSAVADELQELLRTI